MISMTNIELLYTIGDIVKWKEWGWDSPCKDVTY